MGGNHEGEDPFPLMTKANEVRQLSLAYGIDLNAVEIYERIHAWDVDANRRKLYYSKSSPLNYSPSTPTLQTSFEFGARSEWPVHNRQE